MIISMKLKTVIIFVCVFCMHIPVHSQADDLLDTIFPKPQIYGVDTYSYLIEDDSLYSLVKEKGILNNLIKNFMKQ